MPRSARQIGMRPHHADNAVGPELKIAFKRAMLDMHGPKAMRYVETLRTLIMAFALGWFEGKCSLGVTQYAIELEEKQYPELFDDKWMPDDSWKWWL
jgi:hypothetical protein